MIEVRNYPFLGQKNQKQEMERLKQENYSRIYSHEAAHKAAAGSLGGPIVIEYNPQGIPVSGHVSIRIPTLNKANPDETISQAQQVKRAALAPSDELSSADLNVAKTAQGILNEAQEYKKDQSKKGNRLDIVA